MKHAYYSAAKAAKHGTLFWKNANGEEIECTSVFDPQKCKSIDRDDIDLGPVVEWSRNYLHPVADAESAQS